MGIKPEGTEHVTIPPDNVQSRWGEWEAELTDKGDVAGGVLLDTWSLADSANTQAGDLKDRLDLIPLGYCSAYMDRNINLEWGNNNERKAPFKSQIGPAQGAHIRVEDSSVVFDLPGTWTVHAFMNCDGTNYTGNNNITMKVTLWKPDGTFHRENFVQSSPNTNPDSLTISQPFVIPEPDYYVQVWVWSGRWRWWRGGTRNSGLTVLRAALGTDNTGSDDVPDETQGG